MAELSPSQRLVKYGFIKPDKKPLYKFDEKKKVYRGKEGYHAGHADEEVAEEANNQYYETGFPRPYKRYRVILESFSASIEESYYWVLGHIRQDQAFPYVDKITDIFSASENSAFFGQSAQRLGIQQDRASQYLATIGKLTKDFFPLVRELRILDERLIPYEEWDPSDKSKRRKSADITLKGLFIDFAEGGTKNPASVYGLAQQVGFTILPDLFFNTHVYSTGDVESTVDAMQWNPQVKNILKRKLYQYVIWVQKTHLELKNRRRFTLKYLRQHWHIVKMYISWVKPYLKTVKRLTMNQQQIESPDLVSAFESSMTEIEILAKKPHKGDIWQVILATFRYRTRPAMQYRQEYQQGPVHVGRIEIFLRAYGWTAAMIDAYKRMKEDEELELLGMIDKDLKDAMDSFGDEIQKYLVEAGEEELKEEGKKEKDRIITEMTGFNPVEPFVATVKGFGELFGPLFAFRFDSGKAVKMPDKKDISGAASLADRSMYQVYKNYKKAHGMFAP